ncbi:MAG: NAD(P)-binding domain-containing protein [Actinobacteria bacterium]|nr:NAD(P)-binding domain-containing protein [Actinomycetota bacterium]
MIIGFVGSGNMAAALARGLAGEVDGMLFSDLGSGRAAALAAEVGGEAVSSAAVAARADVVILAVKPAALDTVAPGLGEAREIVSVLAATPLERLREAFPGASVLRTMPNVGVEVRQGVICVAGDASPEVRAALGRIARVFEIDEEDFDAATAVMGCAPAYLALAMEAIADAGADDGLDPGLARELIVETTAGTAELLRRRSPAELIHAVASPGGSTEPGLEELERQGARAAFAGAVDASLRRMRG